MLLLSLIQTPRAGVDFIRSNFEYAVDAKQVTPIGFEIIFPGMIQQAGNFDLNLVLEAATLRSLFQKRDSELKRYFFVIRSLGASYIYILVIFDEPIK